METRTARSRPTEASGTPPVPPAPGSRELPAPRRKSEPRPVPIRNDHYGHLSIAGLRDYRCALSAEESNVSYWRRILQARLDVVGAGSSGRGLDFARLRPVLTSERVSSGRRALVQVLPIDDIPPLPHLAELWDRCVDDHDAVGRAAFMQELRAAEAQLSAYRSVLHRRIGEATGELIARYCEQPVLCLTALPLPPPRRASA